MSFRGLPLMLKMAGLSISVGIEPTFLGTSLPFVVYQCEVVHPHPNIGHCPSSAKRLEPFSNRVTEIEKDRKIVVENGRRLKDQYLTLNVDYSDSFL